MLWLLVKQDLRQRFTGSVLGGAWAVLAPLLQLIVFAVVFVHIFKARIPGLNEQGYVAYLALGMWPWFAFSEAVARGATGLTDAADLLDKVAVSTWQVVQARVVGAFIIHGIGFLCIVALLVLWLDQISVSQWLFTLPAWAALFLLGLAMAQISAICNVFARDTQQILTYLLMAWMFLSPILYDADLVPQIFAPWMKINPMTSVIAAIRDPLIWPEQGSLWPLMGFVWVLATLGIAAFMHRRFRPFVREFL